MDWNLADLVPDSGLVSHWTAESRSRMCWQRGGVALLADLVASVLAPLSETEISVRDFPSEPVRSDDSRFHHAYAMWGHDNDGAWRVCQFLGIDPRTAELEMDSELDTVRAPNLVILDDAALGFRDHSDVWPEAVRHPSDHTWFLLKTASPVAAGKLWEHLSLTCPGRLIVVLTVDDLRRTEVQISRGLSWERTAQDIAWELVYNPRVNGLGQCAHTIVSLGTAGAVLQSVDPSQTSLVFDPANMEEEWESANCGQMIGNTSTLTAALARQIVASPDSPDFVKGLQSGIHAMRILYQTGYCGNSVPSDDGLSIGFPTCKVSEAIQQTTETLAVVKVQDPVRFLKTDDSKPDTPERAGFWTILEDRYRDGLVALAQSIVLRGINESLTDVPIGRIGFLTTVDRHEIESLRSIQSLMREYCRHRQQEPLSIAVFGPPGSGKSFGVEQVARSIESEPVETLTFNLSQFDDPGKLLGALHQVRDVGLSGKLPLVFWDEFDSALDGQALGWLRYFLAPMQDGVFQEGQLSHPIGRSIFVFAGGTCATMDEFTNSLATQERRKSAKLPDFVSRLRGFLNVLGPNPPAQEEGTDPYYIIRRAILIRSMLERQARHLFKQIDGIKQLQIDNGVLQALLQTRCYKHGVRSIKSILSMSQLAGMKSFQRSSLPAESQLDLHVEGREFLALVQSMVLTPELTETLAEAAHEVWRAGKLIDEWQYGSEKDEEQKTHPWLTPYEDLPPQAQEANRVTIRTIPLKLSLAGYAMVPARSDEPALQFPGDDLEKLAQYEHELWMKAKLDAGYRLGTATPEEPLLNEYLVTWEDVPDNIRESDRDLIRGIPKILAKAGYAIMKLNRS